jgi:hypothetical protein
LKSFNFAIGTTGGRVVVCYGLASEEAAKAEAFNAMERRRPPCIAAAPRIVGLHPPTLASLSDNRPEDRLELLHLPLELRDQFVERGAVRHLGIDA